MQHLHYTESETSLTGPLGAGEVQPKLTLTGGVAVLSIAFATMLFSAHEGALYRLDNLSADKTLDKAFPAKSLDKNSHQLIVTSSLRPGDTNDLADLEPNPSREVADHSRLITNSTTQLASKLIKSSFLASSKGTLDVEDAMFGGNREASTTEASLLKVLGQSTPTKQSEPGKLNEINTPEKKERIPEVYANVREGSYAVIPESSLSPYNSDIPTDTNAFLKNEARLAQAQRKPAESLFTPEPKYPNQAVRKLLEAEVNVSFVVNVYGQVEQVTFESMPNRHFARSIQRALEKWRFVPATLDGQNVESQLSQTFSFSEPEKRLLYITGTRFPKVLKTSYLPKKYKT